MKHICGSQYTKLGQSMMYKLQQYSNHALSNLKAEPLPPAYKQHIHLMLRFLSAGCLVSYRTSSPTFQQMSPVAKLTCMVTISPSLNPFPTLCSVFVLLAPPVNQHSLEYSTRLAASMVLVLPLQALSHSPTINILFILSTAIVISYSLGIDHSLVKKPARSSLALTLFSLNFKYLQYTEYLLTHNDASIKLLYSDFEPFHGQRQLLIFLTVVIIPPYCIFYSLFPTYFILLIFLYTSWIKFSIFMLSLNFSSVCLSSASSNIFSSFL